MSAAATGLPSHSSHSSPSMHLGNVSYVVHQAVRESRRGCRHEHGVGPNGPSHSSRREPEVCAHRQADEADAEILCRRSRWSRWEAGKGQSWVEHGGGSWALACPSPSRQLRDVPRSPAALTKAAWADTAMTISGSVMPRVAIM